MGVHAHLLYQRLWVFRARATGFLKLIVELQRSISTKLKNISLKKEGARGRVLFSVTVGSGRSGEGLPGEGVVASPRVRTGHDSRYDLYKD